MQSDGNLLQANGVCNILYRCNDRVEGGLSLNLSGQLGRGHSNFASLYEFECFCVALSLNGHWFSLSLSLSLAIANSLR